MKVRCLATGSDRGARDGVMDVTAGQAGRDGILGRPDFCRAARIGDAADHALSEHLHEGMVLAEEDAAEKGAPRVDLVLRTKVLTGRADAGESLDGQESKSAC